MALRDKLRERSQQHLEPGEQVQQVFLAQTGPNPLLGALTYLIAFWVKYYVVAVTDRRIVVMRAGIWTPAKPKSIATWADRNTNLGPLSGLWGKMQLNGERYWVNKRFHRDVAEADWALTAGAQQLQPPPQFGAAHQSYQHPAYPAQPTPPAGAPQ